MGCRELNENTQLFIYHNTGITICICPYEINRDCETKRYLGTLLWAYF